MGYLRLYQLPAGVTVSALSLIASLLVFFGVSWVTRARASSAIDADIRLVMDA
jgi:hypothetical protein